MQNKVSEIQIIPLKPQDGLVALASFIYDNAFYCGSVGIYTRPLGGHRLTYPTKKTSTSTFALFYPINRELGTAIENSVCSQYEKLINSTF